jgi:hypothetical protein
MTTTVKYQPNSTATASPMTDSKFCSCWNTIEVYWSIVEHRMKRSHVYVYSSVNKQVLYNPWPWEHLILTFAMLVP